MTPQHRIRCVGISCPPPHESHDKRVRAVYGPEETRIRTIRPTWNPRVRAVRQVDHCGCVSECGGETNPLSSPEAPQSVGEAWSKTSQLVYWARLYHQSLSTNSTLELEMERWKGTGLEPILALWIGDNFRYEAEWEEAIPKYRVVVDRFQDVAVFGRSIAPRALESIATCHVRLGQFEKAVEALVELTRMREPDTSLVWVWLEIANLYELLGKRSEVIRSLISATQAPDGIGVPSLDWRYIAKQRLAAMTTSSQTAGTKPGELIAALKNALKQRDGKQLRALASKFRFSLGVAACDGWFCDGAEAIDVLSIDLEKSRVTLDDSEFIANNGRAVLWTYGWMGDTFMGPVAFIVESTVNGWEWTGVSNGWPNARLQALYEHHHGHTPHETNQDLELPIKAPWPAGQSFTAGGLNEAIDVLTGVATLGLPFFLLGALVALGPAAVQASVNAAEQWNQDANAYFIPAAFVLWIPLAYHSSRDACGFGIRGFYYGGGGHVATRDFVDAFFAIDFVRFQRGLPFLNLSNQSPACAVADGIVVRLNLLNQRNLAYRPEVRATATTPFQPAVDTTNYVEMIHLDINDFHLLARLISQAGAVPSSSARGDTVFSGFVPGAATQFRNNLDSTRRNAIAGARGVAAVAALTTVSPPRGRVRVAAGEAGSQLASGAVDRPIGGDGGAGRRRQEQAGQAPYDPFNEALYEDRQNEARRLRLFGRYASRYLHLDPRPSGMSLFQLVPQGAMLAIMDSTGISATPHLHFEMHDRDLVIPWRPSSDWLGPSVRPTPMDVDPQGRPQQLEDLDDGKCVHSTNVVPTDYTPIFPWSRR